MGSFDVKTQQIDYFQLVGFLIIPKEEEVGFVNSKAELILWFECLYKQFKRLKSTGSWEHELSEGQI